MTTLKIAALTLLVVPQVTADAAELSPYQATKTLAAVVRQLRPSTGVKPLSRVLAKPSSPHGLPTYDPAKFLGIDPGGQLVICKGEPDVNARSYKPISVSGALKTTTRGDLTTAIAGLSASGKRYKEYETLKTRLGEHEMAIRIGMVSKTLGGLGVNLTKLDQGVIRKAALGGLKIADKRIRGASKFFKVLTISSGGQLLTFEAYKNRFGHKTKERESEKTVSVKSARRAFRGVSSYMNVHYLPPLPLDVKALDTIYNAVKQRSR